MRFALPLAIKLGLRLALTGLLLPLAYAVTLPGVLDVTVLTWMVSFFAVDLLVLPAAGRAAAALADLLLVMAGVWVVLGVGPSWALLGIGSAFAAVEYFFDDALLTRGLVGRRPR